MLPLLTHRLLRKWHDLFPDVNKPSAIRYLGIAGAIEGGTTTFLGFTDKNPKPAFVAKVHRHPGAEEKVKNEKCVISYLQSLRGSVSECVPQILLCDKISGTWAIVQSVIEGWPMSTELTEEGLPEIRNAVRDMNTILGWLLALHSETESKEPSVCKAVADEQKRRLETFLTVFDLSPLEEAFGRQMLDAIGEIAGGGGAVEHGDFCRHNILIPRNAEKNRIGIIDWTESKRYGFLLHDLFYFLATYFFQIRKYHGIPGLIHAFEHTFFGETEFNRAIKRSVLIFCGEAGLDPAVMEDRFGLFLINQAVVNYEKVQRCALYGGLPRFNVYLASLQGLNYGQATREQIWIHLFRFFVKNRKRMIF